MASGIYKIVNIKNNKFYIGSAKDFEKRWKRHLYELRSGKHSSIKLLNAFKKYGEESFKFIIIEECEYNENILKLEQHYIDTTEAKKVGYNIADATFGDTISHHINKRDIIKRRVKTMSNKLKNMSKQDRSLMFGRCGSNNGNWKPEIHQHCKHCGKRITVNSSIKKVNICKLCLNRQRAKKVSINGIIYNSISEASRKLNIPTSTISDRIKSKNFKEYRTERIGMGIIQAMLESNKALYAQYLETATHEDIDYRKEVISEFLDYISDRLTNENF